MTEKAKGTQYRAVTNVSFGKDRGPVKAGDLFYLDDDDVAKDLIARGAISKNTKPTADELTAENPVGSTQQVDTRDEVNKGEPPNAAMTRGMDADAKAAGKPAPEGYANTGTEAGRKQAEEVQGSAKGASAGGPGKTTAPQK